MLAFRCSPRNIRKAAISEGLLFAAIHQKPPAAMARPRAFMSTSSSRQLWVLSRIGGVKHFQSLAPAAQEHGVPIGKLRGRVNPGHYPQIDEAGHEFSVLAREIIRRADI